jgi:hypothetical protein
MLTVMEFRGVRTFYPIRNGYTYEFFVTVVLIARFP